MNWTLGIATCEIYARESTRYIKLDCRPAYWTSANGATLIDTNVYFQAAPNRNMPYSIENLVLLVPESLCATPCENRAQGQHSVYWQLIDDNSFSYSFALRMSGPVNHHVWKCLELKNTDTKYIKAGPPWCISINHINESMAMFALEQNQITFDVNSKTSPHWWSESILVN